MTSTFDQFTNQFSLSKTLRFELIPTGSDGERLTEENANELLASIISKDKEVKVAYDALKPIMDSLHEEVITRGLESNEAKAIEFQNFYEIYKSKGSIEDRKEANLRDSIVKAFNTAVQPIIEKANIERKILKKKDVNCLVESGIFKYLGSNLEYHVDPAKLEDVRQHLDTFIRFTGYFSGYNENRKNYYDAGKKSTSVATRIVHENLPKFCDNIILFQEERKQKKKGSGEGEIIPSRKDEYLEIYNYLKAQEKVTQIKDAESNKMIEAYPITGDIFDIKHFNYCLSQDEIEQYNKIIGHYNSLINLYNQARKGEQGFRKISQFKTLYKQIGCGKRKLLFDSLKYETFQEQRKKSDSLDQTLSLDRKLEECSEQGLKYFTQSKDVHNITIYTFINWLKSTETWAGVYWTKQAVNVISNHYLANWHELQEIIKSGLQEQRTEFRKLCNSLATFSKNRQEQFKLHDAVELSSLFEVIDKHTEVRKLFKESILEDENYKKVIDSKMQPSENLIALICYDIEQLAEIFISHSQAVLEIKEYKKEENIKIIKEWLDNAVAIIRRVKNFYVREEKVKGNTVDAELSNIVKALISSEEVNWTKSYDLVRNYLTKKPQDDAKANKLKLNFGKGNLLGGFVDSYSKSDNATQYGAYLFRKKVEGFGDNVYDYFIGISQNAHLFRCHKQNEIVNDDKSEFERLEYYQAKSTTYFDNQYSSNKLNLVKTLETLINQKKSSIDRVIKKTSKENIINEVILKLKLSKKKLKELLELEGQAFQTAVNSVVGDQAENIIKRDKKGEITPTTIIGRVSKKELFSSILHDGGFLDSVHKTIKGLKSGLSQFESKTPELKNIKAFEYKGIAGLKRIIEDLQKVAKENKVFNFFNVSQTEFNEACSSNFWLFKISNKDLSHTESKNIRPFRGTENLHTMIFRALMRENSNCMTVDIGRGEIFFRNKAVTKVRKHSIGEKMLNRIRKDKNSSIPEKVYLELFNYVNNRQPLEALSNEAKSYLKPDGEVDSQKVTVKEVVHEIIKDRRFTLPKLQLHLSTMLNFASENSSDINYLVNQNFDDALYLGIDRGEKHLIYYSLVNSKGEIIDQGNFDIIKNKNYLESINEAAKLRREKQENWQQKGNIANLKDGYISLVVHEIVQKLKDEHGNFRPTFIVQEKLNKGFKRSRQKFEQQVYQKFELAVAKKLNYLVDKSKQGDELGTVGRALQLTPPIANYQDIEKENQFGVMLYVNPKYTSVTDPVTGWRKSIYIQSATKNNSIKEQVKNKFTEIALDSNGDYYFEYKDERSDKLWRLYSSKNGKGLERYRFRRGKDKNEYIIEAFNPKELLDSLFSDFNKTSSLLEQIKAGKELTKTDNKKTPWESFKFAIDLIQQIRNSGDESKNQDDNFLLSPARDENGNHFDSRVAPKGMPQDADANGAYNIARKGIIMHEHIKQWKVDGMKQFKKDKRLVDDLDLFISDEEWDLWTINRDAWHEKLPKFVSQEAKEEKKK